MLKKFLSSYFGFNKQQRNGLLVLLTISFILLILRISLPYFIEPDKIIVKNLPLLPIEQCKLAVKKNESVVNAFPSDNVDTLFAFNPNEVNMSQLLRLGLKEKTAKTFIKFRNTGFVFKQKEDLKKVYGISESMYNKLEPYIIFNAKKSWNRKSFVAKEKPSETKKEKLKSNLTHEFELIEINSADTLLLLKCPEIDKSLANRIIKFKNRLGGFISISQLKEVYGFDESSFPKIKPYFVIDSEKIKKMNPNSATFYRLNNHPYISYEIAKKIIDWRKKTTLNPTNFAELIDNKEVFERLLPYLSFD
jgi:DNA uptake protein ComE-like DNA-binding protein